MKDYSADKIFDEGQMSGEQSNSLELVLNGNSTRCSLNYAYQDDSLLRGVLVEKHKETLNSAIAESGIELEEVQLSTGDTVVQLGTTHAWSNRSDVPCRLFISSHDGS